MQCQHGQQGTPKAEKWVRHTHDERLKKQQSAPHLIGQMHIGHALQRMPSCSGIVVLRYALAGHSLTSSISKPRISH